MIVAEPTMCAPVHGHKGVVRLEFSVQGKTSHSAQPHHGKNAVVAAAKLALALDAEGQHLQQCAKASLQEGAEPAGSPRQE